MRRANGLLGVIARYSKGAPLPVVARLGDAFWCALADQRRQIALG
jgi:hypothetical protein